jgi:hypothetical protein
MGQIGTPTGSLVGGTSAVDKILSDYVFQSGIHEPEVSNILSYKFPQYYMTALLDRIGRDEAIAQDTWSWFVQDRTRKSGTVTDISTDANGISTSTVRFDTDFDYTSAKPGYLIVGDVIRFASGATGRVTAVGAGLGDSGKQNVTVEHVEGATWTADDVAGTGVGATTTGVYGHIFNAFEEGSEAPKGRVYLPDEKYNHLTILRRSIDITGSEFTNKTYIGEGDAWYFEVEGIEMRELAVDKEALIMFGIDGTSGNVKVTQGLWDDAITYGVDTTFASGTGVSETDIQDTLEALLVEGGSDKVLGLCGSKMLIDVNRALRDYHVGGSINYGGFLGAEVGLDVASYRIAGRTVDIVHYALFDDEAIVPFAGTPTSAKTDFKNTMLLLDMGTDQSGRPLISLKYKEHMGQSRKFIHGYEPGMMNPEGQNGGQVSSGFDGFHVYMLCHVGVENRLPNRMAVIRAIS